MQTPTLGSPGLRVRARAPTFPNLLVSADVVMAVVAICGSYEEAAGTGAILVRIG